jgi:hypothetical protein
MSTVIKTVCSSATEAEYAALFLNAKIALWLRTVLDVMGYPQPVTVVQCDNSVAVGIANLSVKPKNSKTIAMRYHWTRDQIAQGYIKVYWRKGADNIADFFTKALPVHKHQEIKNLLVSLPKPNGKINPSLNNRAQRFRANRFAIFGDDDDASSYAG